MAAGATLVAAPAAFVEATAGAAPAADRTVASSAVEEPPAAAGYVGAVEVVRDAGAQDAGVVRGTVFADGDRDSRYAGNDRGVEGVAVSNGREVVVTDEDGAYELPAFEGMTVFVTKPAGYDVPLSDDGLAQFSFHHLPAGSPPLRFGGLPPTGALPSAVNFPLVENDVDPEEQLRCAVLGDVQTYSGAEIGYARGGAVGDLAARDDVGQCGALLLGDVAGDDLGLYPRIKQLMSAVEAPIRAVPGNHDIDFDATDPEHAFDTYKREIGPEYYSYDVGEVHVVGLNNVRYPCTPELDNADGTREHCADPVGDPDYTARIGEEQMAWLERDLALVPEDKLVVIASHIPLVSFVDSEATKHQTPETTQLHALLEGRPALSLSGHTHSLEVLETGDHFAGWQEAVGVGPLPFQHIVAGAVSGDWYGGDIGVNGLPSGLQRDGAVPGYLTFDFTGAEYEHTFHATGRPDDDQMSLSVSSPTWRQWFTTVNDWAEARAQDTDFQEPPPLNVNDLGDPNLVTTADLAGGSSLVANVWAGASSSEVTVQIGDREPAAAARTQQARGEGILEGVDHADPFAATRQLQVARHAFASTSGVDDAQGYQQYRGSQFGPGPAQAGQNVASSSPHLWEAPIPTDLEEGPHTATVRAVDAYGREHTASLTFEVIAERPAHFFRSELFPEDGEG